MEFLIVKAQKVASKHTILETLVSVLCYKSPYFRAIQNKTHSSVYDFIFLSNHYVAHLTAFLPSAKAK